ncbi:hypothetical protein C8R45DRAFT_1029373 [Mycena sanguinolenta]|nr:hypothetical protein C8R45DRAFT_1029373 [Mycena sanguinolenta]
MIFWIRRSTGRLCIELMTIGVEDRIPGLPPIGGMGTLTAPHSIESLHDPNQESRVIASLGFHQWYSLCRECFTRYRHTGISVQAEVKLGSIIFWPTSCQFQDATELAWVVGRELVLRRWRHDRLGVSRGHGPVRYTSGEVFGSIVRVSPWVFQANHTISWFSQANYIFTSLKIPSNYDDYTLINGVEFSLSIPFPEQNPPDGYLFLSSPMEFKTGPSSFRWPDCPAYWSLDPSGSNPLSAEEASILGFPRIELATEIGGVFWDDAVYAGLRKFHVAKGCDPDSQDVAHELGYPLYELSVPVAHRK